MLSGEIPFTLMNLTKLTFLGLSSNNFQGPIPSSIVHLYNLEVLDVYNNNLNGTMELCMFLNMKSLGMLDLSHNELSLLIDETCTNATLPKFYGLDLAACNLSEFPDFLRNQDGLQWLSLAYNNIAGHIPEWMWHISRESLRVMDLSFNFLTGFDGQVPIPLPWTNLAILDLSSNQLEGSLPIPPSSTLRYNIPNNKLSASISENSEDSDSPFEFGWKIVVIGYGFGTVAGVIIGHVVTARNPDWLRKTFGMKQLGRRHRN
ncbi:hypothetical protein CMV_021995 [Castanea mollissima]|uniref:Uncharacterized protein n=1 Tax=Castanea mollissima TaxID=60419 RepID=A0A8J4QSB6_9ROSI|nr:hypothetical protein CMV_021995 [Castanea mollissima]